MGSSPRYGGFETKVTVVAVLRWSRPKVEWRKSGQDQPEHRRVPPHHALRLGMSVAACFALGACTAGSSSPSPSPLTAKQVKREYIELSGAIPLTGRPCGNPVTPRSRTRAQLIKASRAVILQGNISPEYF